MNKLTCLKTMLVTLVAQFEDGTGEIHVDGDFCTRDI
jgi:hypothetical protein